MNDSSSEGTTDEEEVINLFDKAAHIIVQNETLPKKSADRYRLVYDTYKKWQAQNKNSLSTSEENNLIVYFESLKKKLSPLTLWSVWSMLKQTLSMIDNIKIENFLNLKSLIKTNAKGHKPKKSFVLRWDQVKQFMNNAPDDQFLAIKVVLIFGICGCLRCAEIVNMKVDDVEDLNGKYLVSINDNKNDYPGQFVIGNLFYPTVKRYISLRPPDKFSDRFFIHYSGGKCTRSPIGRHTIGAMPQKIASYLKLPNAKRYTGHCFRRSSATLLSESGASMQMIKQLGRWRSDIIAQGYVENSMHNRQMIFNRITQNTTATFEPQPSTSKAVIIDPPQITLNTQQVANEPLEESLVVNCSDFEEDFTVDDVEPILPGTVENSGFTTANNKPISVPVKAPSEPEINNNKRPFTMKPGIKLIFENQSSVPIQPLKKRKMTEDLNTQNHNNLNLTTRFSNCTFNNCVFNITTCTCNKENIS